MEPEPVAFGSLFFSQSGGESGIRSQRKIALLPLRVPELRLNTGIMRQISLYKHIVDIICQVIICPKSVRLIAKLSEAVRNPLMHARVYQLIA